MSTKQFAAQMKAMITDIKEKGTAAIYCDNLISYLDEVEKTPELEPSPIQIEKYKADLQNWIEANKRDHEGQLEMFRSIITSGQAAIKSAFLLNGGAAVAMLAFIGHLAQFKAEKVPVFSICLLPFAYGALAITITSGFTYLSQWFYINTSPRVQKVGFVFNMLSIISGILSYSCFIFGLCNSYRSFMTYA